MRFVYLVAFSAIYGVQGQRHFCCYWPEKSELSSCDDCTKKSYDTDGKDDCESDPTNTWCPAAHPSPSPSPSGSWFEASTTNFDDATGSCGGCSLNMFKDTPNWAAVAVAESMQTPYQCKPCPDCQCATGEDQANAGGPPGGCGQCYEVKTTGRDPDGNSAPLVEFHAAVVDSCPYEDNREWCPRHVHEVNSKGYEFHIDVIKSDVNKLGLGDNPIVQFRPVACPGDILQIMQQNCCDVWSAGQGCNAICPQDHCPSEQSVRANRTALVI